MRPMMLFSLLLFLSPLPGDELRSEAGDQTALSLTIYNEDLALVRDRRRVTLPEGIVDLALRGVSGRMMAATALLRPLDTQGMEVLEQNFNYDLLTPGKLLEKYVGREIRIRRTHPATGAQWEETARVLSTEEGVVVQVGDHIETDPKGSFLFPDIPADLRDEPTLVTRLRSPAAGARELELSYLTTGLGWKADYVARLDRDARRLDLAGWITLHNESGASYRNARLQLVAGKVHRVRPRNAGFDLMATRAMAAPEMKVAEEALLDYHLYTLPRPTDLLNRQSKQVALFEAARIPARRSYRLRGAEHYFRQPYADDGNKQPVQVWLTFDNRQESGLGQPLPAGVVRVYQADSQGRLQFVGEDRIGHTPKGKTVRLRLGEAFDITATRRQLEWRKRNVAPPYHFGAESRFRIRLHNANPRAVTVTVEEPLFGDWEILDENRPHERVSATLARWKVEVPAEGEAVLDYRVLIRQ